MDIRSVCSEWHQCPEWKTQKTNPTEVYTGSINQWVIESYNIDEAEDSFGSILDKHARMKTIQIMKNLSPFLSNKSKKIILTRKALLEESAKTDCKILKREANRLAKVIKKEIYIDRTEYFENKFNHNEDSSNAWTTANELLWTVRDTSERS